MKIFWSWQSDTPSETNKNFVRGILNEIAADLTAEVEASSENSRDVEVLSDTQGHTGAVAIADAILEQIENSDLFIADVTPITQSKNGKLIPNPNVMFEAGWAMKALSHKRCIFIMNSANDGGAPFKEDDLPFDIRHRRIKSYDLSENATKKSAKRNKLKSDLKTIIEGNLKAFQDNQPVHVPEFREVESAEGDPSIWDATTNEIAFKDDLNNIDKTVERVGKNRFYLRVIPEHTEGLKLRVREYKKLRSTENLFASTSGSSFGGESGQSDDGYVAVWFANAANTQTKNVMRWSKENGEHWFIDGGSFMQTDGLRYPVANFGSVFTEWREQIASAINIIKDLHGDVYVRVEVGVLFKEDVLWPEQNENGIYPTNASKNEEFSQVLKNWPIEEQVKFLKSAYEVFADMFGIDPAERLLSMDVFKMPEQA
ncbi:MULTISPECIES: hypothetical protein [unclassified Pseudovibrio]|uniref:hypothetical protein n=1 Tax=unclassified Pseudovibrio TaxID=2627060 RepID=UPI0007AE7EA7|nr:MULTISPECIES: hypothetical protein [unclassified Pseudovibrio]KZK92545.1 hypothetical protein PsW74_05472 [Pseudovibrio sp. W74]KZL03202.1 hypothetical protein PsAD14_05732 [Pseudovibrio sp. Ad14]